MRRGGASLSGPRVLLRPVEASDATEFIALMRKSRGLHRPWTYPPQTEAAFIEMVRRNADARREAFLICLREADAIIGALALSEIVRGNFGNAYLGYYLGAPYTGQGYMTEAIRLLLRHAFRSMGLHRIEANIQPENKDSIAVARRCGFRLEGYSPRYLKIGGRWRDHERWAIVAEDWNTLGSKSTPDKVPKREGKGPSK